MESLADEFRKRQAVKPDQWTLAWWNDQFEQVAKGYRGATHAMNLVLAEAEDHNTAVKDLKKQVEAQAQQIHAANVEIGKIQEEVTLLQESIEKARTAYSELKKKVS